VRSVPLVVVAVFAAIGIRPVCSWRTPDRLKRWNSAVQLTRPGRVVAVSALNGMALPDASWTLPLFSPETVARPATSPDRTAKAPVPGVVRPCVW
jgi:hypothetical protein